MRIHLFIASALVFLSSCTDINSNARADAQSRCCPVQSETCNCFNIGGIRNTYASEALQCERICDAEPDGWEEGVDSEGCPILVWVGGTGSCFSIPPDAGQPDAESPDAGPPDAGPPDAATP